MSNIVELTDEVKKTTNYVMYIKLYCDRNDGEENDKIIEEDILKYLYLATENIYSILWSFMKYNRKNLSNEKQKELLKYLLDSYILSEKCIEKIVYIDLCYRDYLKNGTKSCFYTNYILRKLTEYYDDILDEIHEYLEY